MMKRKTLFLIAAVFSLSMLSAGTAQAAMTDYCVVPPYVVQDVPPNIMIVFDNSGSMFNTAYFDGFHTVATADDNLCTNSGSPCTGFANPGAYPTYKYYGYFDSDYWYTYSSNRFVPSAPKTGSGLAGSRAKLSTEWDGDFLNWLTMRRVDVLRKVMTGGTTTSGEGSSYNRLIGEQADYSGRGIYMRMTVSETYTPNSGTRDYTFSTGGAGTSSFTVSGGGGTYNVAVRVPVPVEGVLQDAVGTRARLGLTFYNVNAPTPHGGYVQVYISGGSLSSTVNQINLTRPNSNTPLAETMWEVTGYFAQQASIAGGPGPRYNSGDFQINNNVDPFNYGTGGQVRYPSCAKSYVLYLTDGEPCSDGNLPATISDYAAGRSNYNCSGSSCPAVGSFPASTFPSCGAGSNVAGIEDVALYAHTTDLRNSPTLGVNNISGTQNLNLYVVFAFGKGSTLLQYAAINGAFEDQNSNNIPDLQAEWDNNNDGVPDTYYEASDGAELEASVRAAVSSMLKRASSGTAASVLASGEGSGANLLQAVFYPRRRFGNDIISWTGENQNLWYYIDPYFTNSNIREDTVQETPYRKLHLINDYISQFYFDTTAQLTKVRRYQDTDGDGAANTTITPDITFESLGSIWKAGELLWSRDITADARTIYTYCISGTTCLGGTNPLTSFSTTNATALRQYLQAADDTQAANIINWVHGQDITEDINPNDGINDWRQRTVTIGAATNVWKLGDILDSTPRISSWIQLATYDTKYNDTTYTDFINTSTYTGRGMVFAGANDGMLHAFKLGKLELPATASACTFGSNEKACLSGTTLGKEIWAFIPKNALPYLKYNADPDYCHVFHVDLTPYLFDASIGAPGSGDISLNDKTVSGWRTILIGGMRYGGACRATTTTCSDVSGDSVKDCVNTPVDVGGSSVGYSSYFALDVTDQNNPVLLWEFSDPALGFTTTGPSIVRIGDGTKNGSWFVVFGSGPTGPIDTTNTQFMGRSDQNLKLFVLDLKTGAQARTPIDTTIPYAFASSMYNANSDTDLDYSDDVVYIGYVKRTGTSPSYTWTEGGIGRIFTGESANASTWTWRPLIDNIGAVTSSVGHLQHQQKGILWLYFGTGRYFYELGTATDDADTQRKLFGIKEPCFSTSGLTSCATTRVLVDFTNVTSIGSVPSEATADAAGFNGWYVNLDASGSYTYLEGATNVTRTFKAERMITDPLAATTGLVFFTTFKPYGDECLLGGKSFIWAFKYNTGGAGGAAMKGTALLQVSTGSIEQKSLSTAFTDAGGRRTSAIEGVPPTAQGLSILSTPPPVKRVIHMKER